LEIKQENETDIYEAVDKVPKLKTYLLAEKLIFESGFESKLFKKKPKILRILLSFLELIPLFCLTIMFFIFASIVSKT